MKKTVALHNLGCKVNAYELEAIQQLLENRGYEIVPFAPGADVYIINTCTVTNIADRKSRQMLHKAKKMNPDAVVVACGCYVQAAGEKLEEDTAIDLIIGNNKKKDLVDILENFLAEREDGGKPSDAECKSFLVDMTHNREYETLSISKTAEHTRAFLKVQDGCNQFCTYCIIPYTRGRVRSRKLLMGEFGHWVFLGCTSAMFVFFAVIQTFRHQIRNQPGNVFARLMRQPRAFWGMQFAHIGVAVFIIGVALVKGYQSERDVRMYEGETVTVAGYTFTFNGVETVRGPNYTADRGDFTLSVNGRELQHLYPEKRKYYSSNSMPMTESAIRHSITGDVYVSLGTPTNDGGWVVRAYYKPYVTWIWWGCIIMAAAGLWAASDRRYRRRKQKNEADGE